MQMGLELATDNAQLPLDVVIECKENIFQKIQTILQELDSVVEQVNFLWKHHALCKHEVKAFIPPELRATHNGQFSSCSSCFWCKIEKDLQIPETVREIIDTSTIPSRKAALSYHPPSGYYRKSPHGVKLEKFPQRVPDTRADPTVVKVLQYTKITPIQTAQQPSKQPIEPRGLRTVTSGASSDPLSEAVGRTEATSPITSYNTKVHPLILQPIGESTIELNPRARHEPLIAKSGYFTFPAYHDSLDLKADIATNGAKKVKSFFATAGSKLLAGLQISGDVYAHREQQWGREYQPFEHVASNTIVLQARDAADNVSHDGKAKRHSQTSWYKKLQNYWKPEPASQLRRGSFLAPCDDGISNIPPVSDYLQRQEKDRSSCIQSSDQPAYSPSRSRTPQRPECIQVTHQPCFSPPGWGPYPQEHQQCRTHSKHPLHRPQPDEGTDEEGRCWEDDEEKDPGTPWSGLETVTEEGYFPAKRTWEYDERRESEEEIGDEVEVDDGDGMDCDGLEASGELCLRHHICWREAMALGGV